MSLKSTLGRETPDQQRALGERKVPRSSMPRSAVTPALCWGSAIGRPTELDLGLPSGELPAGWALLASWVARD